MLYNGTKIGVFYKSDNWMKGWFDDFLKNIDPACISSISKSSSQVRVYLKDGTQIISYPATDSSRGVALDKAFVEYGVSDEIIERIIKPCLKLSRIIFECKGL